VFTASTFRHRMPALSLLVMLSLTTGAFATALCPHLLGGKGSCATIENNSPSHAAPADAGETDHCMHADMSGADANETAEAQPVIEPLPLSEMASGEQISRTNQDCAHCVMHSQNLTAPSSRNAVQPRSSHEPAAAEGPVKGVTPMASLPILALHEHDPPGLSGARHLLINVFRI
jgi:hypothetical protein